MTFGIDFYEEIGLFLISHLCIIVSSFVTLPYKHLTTWETFQMAIPYAWISRIFMTKALIIENEMKYLGPNNMVFFLIVSQFTFTLLGNRFYLKEKTSWSEIVAFCILLVAYIINNYNVVSRIFGVPVKDASGNLIEGPKWLPGNNLLRKTYESEVGSLRRSRSDHSSSSASSSSSS